MLNYVLLEATAKSGVPIQQIVLLGSIILVFYFFMIRPQQKRQKEQRNLLEQIKKGEQVVTIGGIHGKVHEVTDDLVTLEIDNKGSKLSVSKGAISIESTKKYMNKKK
ncbi:MAG: preprotein translocase subunit YajC [Bacteroidota bacterium]